MSPLLDAHAHFFAPGFVSLLPEDCRRVAPDEITLYTALAARHDVRQVLAVGYEGERWATGNNAYLARLVPVHPWVRPVAFVADPGDLTTAQLARRQAEGFVGISLYLLDETAADRLRDASPEVWQWLADHRWLISVNSGGALWGGWRAILDRYPELRLLIAHLGRPPAVTVAPDTATAAQALSAVTMLAAYPQVHVKLSGFYAMTQPGYAYPHTAAWPYVAVLAQAFSTDRLLWASDFSPALEVVSFPQTIHVIEATNLFDAAAQGRIYGDNLARLLAAIENKE